MLAPVPVVSDIGGACLLNYSHLPHGFLVRRKDLIQYPTTQYPVIVAPCHLPCTLQVAAFATWPFVRYRTPGCPTFRHTFACSGRVAIPCRSRPGPNRSSTTPRLVCLIYLTFATALPTHLPRTFQLCITSFTFILHYTFVYIYHHHTFWFSVTPVRFLCCPSVPWCTFLY